ncbi:MAG: hypothetical protein FJ098_03545 [Deltaproteobacteria bacterium]|nr:hypothetical protein [Deltaproteobacteria bacterium]
MKKTLITLVVAAGLLAGAAGAAAQDKRKDVREFNFDEDILTVEFLKPDLEFVGLVKQEQMESLIQIRKDFEDEIVKSAEDL